MEEAKKIQIEMLDHAYRTEKEYRPKYNISQTKNWKMSRRKIQESGRIIRFRLLIFNFSSDKF
jgi:hypothetical protein